MGSSVEGPRRKENAPSDGWLDRWFGDDDASEFQLHHDDVDKHDNRWSASVDNIVRGISVQWISYAMEFAESSERIGDLQQRALDVMPQSPK